MTSIKSSQIGVNAAAMTMAAHADAASGLLKSLANAQRLRILCLLAGGERNVGELNDLLDLSQSALSQHLARLRYLRP